MILGASPLHEDKNLQRYVNRVGRWVASQSSRADLPWAFGVIDTPTVNAFALPGGKVFVSIGLLKRLNNEAELAGVLAHEVAHVMQKHQVKAIQSARTSGALQGVAQSAASERIARTGAGQNALTSSLSNAAAGEAIEFVKNGAFLRPLDKALEYEADRIGAVLAARAGYDPYGLVSAIQILSNMKSDDSGVSLMMSTHPTPNDRLTELEKFAATLDKYASQPQVEDRFAKVMAVVK
jgi:beta-barrel assembly-enhancing protease